VENDRVILQGEFDEPVSVKGGVKCREEISGFVLQYNELKDNSNKSTANT